ncbi:hypothetical protein BPC006_II2349 [Burkholderia pseudomallei BPC006]|nr:hypothetical protein BPC006_II2349 [Burkholderia pseudomallei BPC006]
MLEQTAEHWGQSYFSETFNRREWQAHPLSIQRQYELQGNLMREEWLFHVISTESAFSELPA